MLSFIHHLLQSKRWAADDVTLLPCKGQLSRLCVRPPYDMHSELLAVSLAFLLKPWRVSLLAIMHGYCIDGCSPYFARVETFWTRAV